MGKKKFIDKHSQGTVTYSLVFRSTENADDVPERMLVDVEKGVGVGRVDAELAQQGNEAAAANRRCAGAANWGSALPPAACRRPPPAASRQPPHATLPICSLTLADTGVAPRATRVRAHNLLLLPPPPAGTRRATRWHGCRRRCGPP